MIVGVIYLITCLINGKKYVGQTTQPLKKRITQHKRGTLYIDKAIQKYGWKNFTVQVLEECETQEQLNEREIFWIAELNTKVPNGYNKTGGGGNKDCLTAIQSVPVQPFDETLLLLDCVLQEVSTAKQQYEEEFSVLKRHMDEISIRLSNLSAVKLHIEEFNHLIIEMLQRIMSNSQPPIAGNDNISPNTEESFHDFNKVARLNTFHPAIRLALKYIEEHYREEISQPKIADVVHLNNSYFSTLFKKSVGKGFIDYLNELRIVHVKERLATSSEKAKAIATSEGFNDYQYFVKVFKRLTGLTPSEYRRRFLK